jgi:hypothetical protein
MDKEYTISYQKNPEDFGDVIYSIATKKEALKKAGELKKKGMINIWIDIHIDGDIVDDIKIN